MSKHGAWHRKSGPQRFVAPQVAAPGWRQRAACRDEEPELFFPGPQDVWGEWEAKSVCRRCPVRRECLAWALAVGEHGVWGATNRAERDRMKAGGV